MSNNGRRREPLSTILAGQPLSAQVAGARGAVYGTGAIRPARQSHQSRTLDMTTNTPVVGPLGNVPHSEPAQPGQAGEKCSATASGEENVAPLWTVGVNEVADGGRTRREAKGYGRGQPGHGFGPALGWRLFLDQPIPNKQGWRYPQARGQ